MNTFFVWNKQNLSHTAFSLQSYMYISLTFFRRTFHKTTILQLHQIASSYFICYSIFHLLFLFHIINISSSHSRNHKLYIYKSTHQLCRYIYKWCRQISRSNRIRWKKNLKRKLPQAAINVNPFRAHRNEKHCTFCTLPSDLHATETPVMCLNNKSKQLLIHRPELRNKGCYSRGTSK